MTIDWTKPIRCVDTHVAIRILGKIDVGNGKKKYVLAVKDFADGEFPVAVYPDTKCVENVPEEVSVYVNIVRNSKGKLAVNGICYDKEAAYKHAVRMERYPVVGRIKLNLNELEGRYDD